VTGLMQGKRGLIMGVANDHSIAWGIAKTLAEHGAELAFTYQGEALGKRVKPLARVARLGSLVCPATSRMSPRSTRCSRNSTRRMGRARFRRPRHRLLRQERAQGPLRRRHDAREFHAHHGDLLLLLHRGGAARGKADARRRIAADADLWRLDAGHAELQRDGRRQGRARGERALSRLRSRPRRTSASTRSPPARCARWRAPASPMRG
jgi:hypothetical protein